EPGRHRGRCPEAEAPGDVRARPGRLWNVSSGQTPGAIDGAVCAVADQWHCGPADGDVGLPSGSRDDMGSALARGRQKSPDMDGRMDWVCLCCAAVSSRSRALMARWLRLSETSRRPCDDGHDHFLYGCRP